MSIDVWVIGGTSGIGRATADLLEERDLKVYVSGDEPVNDVRDYAMLEDCYTQLACPQYVVYSAGINRLMWNREMQWAAVADIFNVNVYGFMRLIKVMANHRRTTALRSVVAVSSDAARRPMRTSMAYCASKAALDACVKQAAREHAHQVGSSEPGIRVNAVAPGMTAPTGMSDYIDATVPSIRNWTPEAARRYEASQNPMGDYRIRPREVARAIAYLLLDSPLAQTGSIMEVNCGR